MSNQDSEKDIARVLKYQDELLGSIAMPDMREAERRISCSQELLDELGYARPARGSGQVSLVLDPNLEAPSWEKLSAEAAASVSGDVEIEFLFTEEQLVANAAVIRELNGEYDQIHHLDQYDIAVAAAAGVLAGAVDILLVGVPHKTREGLKAGSLSDYIRDMFDKKFPPEEMERLANSKVSKVPFDAQDNRNTTIDVDGLCTYYHRLYSLGHDPLLGFLFGTADILSGRMTTIDKAGHIVSQVVENYANRRESDVFAALAKEMAHLASDMTTSMGLPVPLMGLLDLFQFGSIGEYEQTVAEIVQGMYYEGYDFIHFCSMSMGAAIVEVAVRIGYALRRIKDGATVGDAIPVSTNHEKMPKLGTMLFIGHSAASAVNAGKVIFTDNPLAINYPQWTLFAKYAYQQLRWGLVTKPEFRNRYVLGAIDGELATVYDDIDSFFEESQSGPVSL